MLRFSSPFLFSLGALLDILPREAAYNRLREILIYASIASAVPTGYNCRA